MPSLLSRIPSGYGLAMASWTLSGDPEPMTASWGFTDDGSTAPNTIAAGMTTRWNTPSAAANMATGWTFTGVVVYVNRGGVLLRGDGPAAVAGSWAVTSPPQSLALIVKKRTSTIGRRYRGRMYLPAAFLDRTLTGNTGLYNITSIGTLQTRMSAWLAAEIATVYDPVLIHAPSLALTPTPITAVIVPQLLGVVRRRMR